ncbi:hypothetical protein PU560_13900 [Georgenia sp. 10Sc9-8]|uniref:Uncharacterized protein n=1 Tax=Georgenia halotolerans TaxID=3028317 RepID=A0ABT5TZQ3_9MICO|nr:hypothetical protein [Georgenia halotolerans]
MPRSARPLSRAVARSARPCFCGSGADAAQYWDSPGGRTVQLISITKSKVAGERYDGGDTDTVQLS